MQGAGFLMEVQQPGLAVLHSALQHGPPGLQAQAELAEVLWKTAALRAEVRHKLFAVLSHQLTMLGYRVLQVGDTAAVRVEGTSATLSKAAPKQ